MSFKVFVKTKDKAFYLVPEFGTQDEAESCARYWANNGARFAVVEREGKGVCLYRCEVRRLDIVG